MSLYAKYAILKLFMQQKKITGGKRSFVSNSSGIYSTPDGSRK